MSRSRLRAVRPLLLVLAVPVALAFGGAQAQLTVSPREPLPGTWLLYHGNHPRVPTTITRPNPEWTGEMLIIADAAFRGMPPTPLINNYDNDRDNLCLVPPGTVIARFNIDGVNKEGQRMYRGSILGATLSADGKSCSLTQSSYWNGAGARLEAYGEPNQRPALPFGPANYLEVWTADKWNNRNPTSAGSISFARQGGSSPMPLPSDVELGAYTMWTSFRPGQRESFSLRVAGADWGPRAVTWLVLYGPELECHTWQPKTQLWNPGPWRYMELYPATSTTIAPIKADGSASFSGRISASAQGRLDVIQFQARFESWTRVTGTVAYTVYWSATPNEELPTSFDLAKPGNVNVNRCATPTIKFDAFYGIR